MKCTHCGAENPEHAVNCGTCREALKPPVVTGADTPSSSPPPAPTQQNIAPVVVAHSRPRGLSFLNIAAFAAATGVALLIISFLLYVYYHERMMNPSGGLETLISLYDLAKASMYIGSFGWVGVAAGIVLGFWGLMNHGFQTTMSLAKKLDMKTLLKLAVIILVFHSLKAILMLLFYEGDFGNEASEWLLRLHLYTSHLAVISEGFIVLYLLNRLSKAESASAK